MSKRTYTKSFHAGDIIFKEGDPGDCAYLVDTGRVEIQVDAFNGATTPVAILGVGDILGEMAIIDGSPRSATAVALDHCELVEVSKDQLNERIEDADPIVRFLLSILLQRLRETMKDVGDVTKSNLPSEATSTNIVNLKDYKTNADVVEKIKLEKSLKNALDSDEFRVHYQPIIDFATGEVAGFEALMRWHNNERGVVRPDIFMGIAEETSLIVPIGHWIIKKSFRDFAKLKQNLMAQDAYHRELFMSINIAAKQFYDPHLFEVLNKTAKYYSIKPQEIKLEITERVLLAGNFVFDWIKRARKLGYSVALDDFGTGYSSLSYLDGLEVNSLKVDKSFVDKIFQSPKSKSIVRNVIRMAADLNLQIIAEGVETGEQFKMLQKFGCTYMQGYYFSKPLPMAEVFFLLTKKSDKKAA